MRKERMNNKGFSLVELIIVIAIMAILAAALAPQLMKYIEKSRVSTDSTSCSSIESCVNAALADEKAYKEVAEVANDLTLTGSEAEKTIDFEFYIAEKDGKPTVDLKANSSLSSMSKTTLATFLNEVKSSLSSIKAPKQTGMNSYKVTIKIRKTQKVNSGIDTSTTTTKEDVTEVADIKVQTVSYKVTASAGA